MSLKNRNARFWGLVALPALLLSGSIVGCSTTRDVGVQVTMPGVVYGAVRDVGANGQYDRTDNPLPGGSMYLVDINGSITQGPIDRTDEGIYVFMAPPGTYTVNASCVGYGNKSKSVTVSSDKVEKKNFGLQQNPGDNP